MRRLPVFRKRAKRATVAHDKFYLFDAGVFRSLRAGTEVDFVVYGRRGFHALEVKNARRVHSTDLRALRTFRTDYPEADAAMLYRGRERLNIDGIWCLPVGDFLREMVPGAGLLEWASG